MAKTHAAIREHWYDGMVEAFQTYCPFGKQNKVYRTMRARNARIGTLFILPEGSCTGIKHLLVDSF